MGILGDRIRQERQKRHWSLDALAAKTGITKGQLSELETGKTVRPSLQSVERIARVFGLGVDDLLSQSNYNYKCAAIPYLGGIPASPLEHLKQEANRGAFIPVPLRLLDTVAVENTIAVDVRGSCLASDGINVGDYLVIERAAPFENDALYLIRTSSEITVAHLYKSEVKMFLRSDVGMKEVPLEDIEVLGRVRYITHWRSI